MAKEKLGTQLKSLVGLPLQSYKAGQAKQRETNVNARLKGALIGKAIRNSRAIKTPMSLKQKEMRKRKLLNTAAERVFR